jgi:hypothetical protein
MKLRPLIISFLTTLLLVGAPWSIADNHQVYTGDPMYTGSAGNWTQASDDIDGVKYPRTKIVIGADNVNGGDVSATNPLPVTISNWGGGAGTVAIDQTTVGTTDSVTVKSTGHSATVTITRPSNTDAYLAGDVIGDTNGSAIFTFPNMARAAGDVIITSIEVEIDASSIPSGMTGFNVRLYNASPTAIADNAAWDLPAGDRGKYLGKIAVNTPVDEGSTLFSDNDQLNKQVTLTSTSLYVELQTLSGFTPTSAAVKRITIHTLDS